jgi:Domain of unknown function (DUF3597)
MQQRSGDALVSCFKGERNQTPRWRSSPSVDVAAVLGILNEKVPQKLDWTHSIVDLLMLLSLDSSLARKELAKD